EPGVGQHLVPLGRGAPPDALGDYRNALGEDPGRRSAVGERVGHGSYLHWRGRGGHGGVPARLATVDRRSGPPRLRPRTLDHRIAPEVVRVAGRRRQLAAAAGVGAGEVLAALPGAIGLLAA